MYAKLVFRNAKRSVKDYLIYIVTMTICVTLFYSFLSISTRYYQPDILFTRKQLEKRPITLIRMYSMYFQIVSAKTYSR